MQLARIHTGRFEIVTLRHGYSGRSALAQSMAGQIRMRAAREGRTVYARIPDENTVEFQFSPLEEAA